PPLSNPPCQGEQFGIAPDGIDLTTGVFTASFNGSDGDWLMVAQYTDAAGNVGWTSVPVVLDTAAPALGGSVILGSDVGTRDGSGRPAFHTTATNFATVHA